MGDTEDEIYRKTMQTTDARNWHFKRTRCGEQRRGKKEVCKWVGIQGRCYEGHCMHTELKKRTERRSEGDANKKNVQNSLNLFVLSIVFRR